MIIKTLLCDIETSPNVNAMFGLRAEYVPHDQMLKDWHIICAAWKWLGEDKVHSAVTYNENDKNVVKKLREAILQADEIVYHNGHKFDYKKLNTRIILNDLPPITKPREVDTLVQARKHFAFTSNKLDFLAKVLLGKGKLRTDMDLWLRALRKDKEAIDYMLEYNKMDVILLEEVYLKLKPHIDVGMNKNMITQTNVCAHCGSGSIKRTKWMYTLSTKYKKYQCGDCGAWWQDGKREKLNRVVGR